MECTWVGCDVTATNEQFDKNGLQWADLCDEHHKLLDETLGDKTKIKEMLAYWVKAQGGAKIATKRVING